MFHFCIYRKPSEKCPTKITIPRGLLEAGPLPLPSAGSSIERTLYYVHILPGSIFSSFANLLCVLFSVPMYFPHTLGCLSCLPDKKKPQTHTPPSCSYIFAHFIPQLLKSAPPAICLPVSVVVRRVEQERAHKKRPKCLFRDSKRFLNRSGCE